mgnify:FL=1|jgi:hypothetical protein|tara:strand:+ start:191 stop:394 length:204 start_codon:yes stop_codon:yes gene_type:complete
MKLNKTEKELINELGSLIDELYSNGANSMYGHGINESLVISILELSYKRKVTLNMPNYDESIRQDST